jgi:hypothetical protein
MVVLIPNSSTSACNASIQSSRPNLAAQYAELNLQPDRPAPDEIDTMCANRFHASPAAPPT